MTTTRKANVVLTTSWTACSIALWTLQALVTSAVGYGV